MLSFQTPQDGMTVFDIFMTNQQAMEIGLLLTQQVYKNREKEVITIADKLYREANPNGNKDTPSFVYEAVEKSNTRRLEANSKLSLYDWCKQEQENSK